MWRSRQCSNKNGFGPNKQYCKVHSPEGISLRDNKMRADWEAKQKQRQTAFARIKELQYQLRLAVDAFDAGDDTGRWVGEARRLI